MTTLADLITNLVERGVRLGVRDGRLSVDAPRGVLTDTDHAELYTRRQALLAALTRAGGAPDIDVVAVRVWLRHVAVEAWVVEDCTVLNEHSDIGMCGLAVFTREEVEVLRDTPAEMLRAVYAAKLVFPGSEVIEWLMEEALGPRVRQEHERLLQNVPPKVLSLHKAIWEEWLPNSVDPGRVRNGRRRGFSGGEPPTDSSRHVRQKLGYG